MSCGSGDWIWEIETPPKASVVAFADSVTWTVVSFSWIIDKRLSHLCYYGCHMMIAAFLETVWNMFFLRWILRIAENHYLRGCHGLYKNSFTQTKPHGFAFFLKHTKLLPILLKILGLILIIYITITLITNWNQAPARTMHSRIIIWMVSET